MELFQWHNALPELSNEQFAMILGLLELKARQPLITAYKESCIRRRIAARIRRSGCRDVEQYIQLLQADAAEAERLNNSLMIHVSQFFRNPSLFDALQQNILPGLVRKADQRGDRVVRLWSHGCSAGEEPYSLAMLLLESFTEELRQGRFEILATDVDSRTLAAARQGLYNEASLRELSLARRERFFSHNGAGWQLNPAVLQLVSFRQMDLQQVNQYGAADLVLCRNTLIYFYRTVQLKILHGLANILPQDGILVLGKSESLPAALRDRFETVDPEERIYCRR